MNKESVKKFLILFVVLFCIIFLLQYFYLTPEVSKELSADVQDEVVQPTQLPVESISVAEEYDMEILPDGLYIYHVDGAYMTVGIQTTGRESSTGNRAGHITFYASVDNGDSIATYETVFVRTDNNEFWCVEDKYHLSFTECGTLKVKQIVGFDELGTDISFEGEYMFLYSFNNDNTYGKGDGQCAI